MTTYVHRCMIVPAAHVALARTLCADIPEGDAGRGMFLTPLSPTGTGEPTHYISAGLIDADMAGLMDAGPEMVYGAAQQRGVATTYAAVAALLADCDIGTEEAFAAMDRLGLRIVQEQA